MSAVPKYSNASTLTVASQLSSSKGKACASARTASTCSPTPASSGGDPRGPGTPTWRPCRNQGRESASPGADQGPGRGPPASTTGSAPRARTQADHRSRHNPVSPRYFDSPPGADVATVEMYGVSYVRRMCASWRQASRNPAKDSQGGDPITLRRYLICTTGQMCSVRPRRA